MICSAIGPVVVLAPIAGVSDFPFRHVVRKYGQPSWVCSEMVASQAMIRHIKKSLQRNCHHEPNTVVQLMGNEPEVMAEAARMSVELGASAIDINMSCPAKKIAVKSDAGAALMRKETLVAAIFKSIVSAVPVPVSVKLRKGWDEQNQNALNLARIAHNEGLSHVTIHGRTRMQLFHGSADWDFIQQVHQEAPLPIIGNGDILSEQDAAIAITKASGIMIARGTYGRPWFLDQVRHYLTTRQLKADPTLAEQKSIVHEHLDVIFTHYDLHTALVVARKHLGWYSRSLERAADFRTTIFSETQPAQFFSHVERFYDAQT